MAARLGILAGFTAMFALCLKLLTGSRRIEIFAATSTYVRFQLLAYPGIEIGNANGKNPQTNFIFCSFAAVLVVFLSGPTGQIP
jgi:hypothetical protein